MALPELTQIFEKVKSLISLRTNEKSAAFSRELDGLEDGFYIAPDFDGTPDCFKEYMLVTSDSIIPQYDVKTAW